MRQEYEYMESLLPALGVYGHVELVSEIIDQLRVSYDTLARHQHFSTPLTQCRPTFLLAPIVGKILVK